MTANLDVLKTAIVKIPVADDVKAIHDAMLECGLYPYEQWMLNEFPPELYEYCGRGIGLWQMLENRQKRLSLP